MVLGGKKNFILDYKFPEETDVGSTQEMGPTYEPQNNEPGTHSEEHRVTNEVRNVCKNCIKLSSTLKLHPHMHKCDVCTKSFKVPSRVKRHLRTHTGERPYQCDRCEKCCKQSSHLKEHQLTHKPERPFKCNLCTKAFKMSCRLKAHLRKHTGEQPVKCDKCKKHFTQ